jgi:hypothetical protein
LRCISEELVLVGFGPGEREPIAAGLAVFKAILAPFFEVLEAAGGLVK